MKRLQIILTVLILVAAVALALYITFYEPATGPTASPTASTTAPSDRTPGAPSVRLVTWNLYNFGRSKNNEEMAFIAQQLRNYDVVAIQEVSTSPPGPQAVARLDAALDRMGFQWDYRISDPTTGDGSERYAYLWKPSRVRLVGRAWLEPSLAAPIDREPYLARFEQRSSGQRFLVASLHAVPRSKDPEREVALLDTLHHQYPDDHIIILGDFNLDEDDEAYDELRALGYGQVLDDQSTSLRRKRRDEPNGHLANEYDNIFYESAPLWAARAGVVDFTTSFETLRAARRISDHLPVFMDVQWTTSAVPAQ